MRSVGTEAAADDQVEGLPRDALAPVALRDHASPRLWEWSARGAADRVTKTPGYRVLKPTPTAGEPHVRIRRRELHGHQSRGVRALRARGAADDRGRGRRGGRRGLRV